jgi:hypothetical protein
MVEESEKMSNAFMPNQAFHPVEFYLFPLTLRLEL